MKLVLLYAFIYLVSPMLSQTTKTVGDPIPGVDVKLGRKPPGGNILAAGKTDEKGVFEFKNMEAGKGYYLEFGIKENGIKSAPSTFEIDGIDTSPTGTAGNPSVTRGSTPKVITKVHGDYEITITITEVATTERGSINKSRSNIKSQIVKKTNKLK